MSFILLGILNAQAQAAAATTFDLLETQNLGSSSAVTFSGISAYSDYDRLQIRGVVRNNATMQFNSDSGTNYNWHRLRGWGGSVQPAGIANATSIPFKDYAENTANYYSSVVVDIANPHSTTEYKAVRSFNGFYSAFVPNIALFSGAWRSTSAITSIEISTLATYSSVQLYGYRSVN